MYVSSAGAGAALGGAALGSGLAFTGIDAAYAACAGFALVAAGLAVVRVAPSLRRRAAVDAAAVVAEQVPHVARA